jgi:hypothetical protein
MICSSSWRVDFFDRAVCHTPNPASEMLIIAMKIGKVEGACPRDCRFEGGAKRLDHGSQIKCSELSGTEIQIEI